MTITYINCHCDNLDTVKDTEPHTSSSESASVTAGIYELETRKLTSIIDISKPGIDADINALPLAVEDSDSDSESMISIKWMRQIKLFRFCMDTVQTLISSNLSQFFDFRQVIINCRHLFCCEYTIHYWQRKDFPDPPIVNNQANKHLVDFTIDYPVKLDPDTASGTGITITQHKYLIFYYH